MQLHTHTYSHFKPNHRPSQSQPSAPVCSRLLKVVPASGLETDDTMTKPKPSFSPRWISTSYGCREAGTTALPLPPPPPLPMPLVEPLPELTVLSEFWLPCGVRLPSVRLGAWVLLWWEEAGDGGTSPSPLDTVSRKRRQQSAFSPQTQWHVFDGRQRREVTTCTLVLYLSKIQMYIIFLSLTTLYFYSLHL